MAAGVEDDAVVGDEDVPGVGGGGAGSVIAPHHGEDAAQGEVAGIREESGAGFGDWDDFLKHLDMGGNSSPVQSLHFYARDLAPGDRIFVSWKPDRRCTFRYLGDSRFIVEKAENSKLKEGNTFSASIFILGEPLHLSELVQGNNPPVAFVIGNKDGLCELERMQEAR